MYTETNIVAKVRKLRYSEVGVPCTDKYFTKNQNT